jgi:hypothetical protein
VKEEVKSMTEKEPIPQSYWEDFRWAAEHGTELSEQYEDVWVAIVDQQVVASGPNLARVEKIAAQKTGRSRKEIVVRYIESGVAVYGQRGALY